MKKILLITIVMLNTTISFAQFNPTRGVSFGTGLEVSKEKLSVLITTSAYHLDLMFDCSIFDYYNGRYNGFKEIGLFVGHIFYCPCCLSKPFSLGGYVGFESNDIISGMFGTIFDSKSSNTIYGIYGKIFLNKHISVLYTYKFNKCSTLGVSFSLFTEIPKHKKFNY